MRYFTYLPTIRHRVRSSLSMVLTAVVTVTMTVAIASAAINGDPTFPEPDDDTIDCFANTTASYFYAIPGSINEGQSSTLYWSVSMPSGCNLQITINGQSVNKSGSLVVRPDITKTYYLKARESTAYKTLKSVRVTVVITDELWTSFQYESNFPNEGDPCWSEEAQGIANNSTSWYVSSRYFIRRFHRSTSLDSCNATHTFNLAPRFPYYPYFLTFPYADCDHIGDIDHYQGSIYAPLEGCSGSSYSGANRIFVFDANLNLQKAGILSQAGAPWVAINPVDGLLYSSKFRSNVIRVYNRNFSDGGYLSFQHNVYLPETLDEIQGGAFSPSGHLYLTVGFSEEPQRAGIYVYKIVGNSAVQQRFIHPNGYKPGGSNGEEIEGITIWDVDGLNIPGANGQPMQGQIHWILLDNDWPDRDDVYFKHISVDGPGDL